MSKRRATTPEGDSKEMEQVKKLEIRGNGSEKTKEYVLFRGDAVFVTEMNVVCLSGPLTGEERVTVTLRTLINQETNYMIGKSVKLGFLIQDYSDRSGIPKLQLRFFVRGKQFTEDQSNQTPEELGLINGDLIHVILRLGVDAGIGNLQVESTKLRQAVTMGGSFDGSRVVTNTSIGARRLGSLHSNLMDKRSRHRELGIGNTEVEEESYDD
ncbi:hypothetical protein K1719_016781 [Acacia pycnantha]|nr:hypothetical protein K1719_016781 [Acacia pycnantha]